MITRCVEFVVTVPTKILRRITRESFLNKPDAVTLHDLIQVLVGM